MSDETTPLILGDAVASEFGRPSRRRSSRRKKKISPPLSHCENCGASLFGPFCAQCGQAAIDYRRSLGSLITDAADAFFNFDARFFQSFGLLLTRPWRLTNEFIEGKRARHVHPLRVYLIASVIFFLVVNFLTRSMHVQEHGDGDHVNYTFGPEGTKPTKNFVIGGGAKPSPTVPPGAAISPSPAPNGASPRLGTTPPSASADASPPPPSAPSTPPKPSSDSKKGILFSDDDNDIKNAPPFVKFMERRAKEKFGAHGDRADIYMKTLIANIAPMVLCCIPLFAFVLKILYFFRRRLYIDHLIFALHTHAFVFLSTVIIMGLGFLLALKSTALTAVTCTFLGIAVTVLLVVAIRRVYRQKWFLTIFKFLLGSAIYFILLSIAFAATAVITILLP